MELYYGVILRRYIRADMLRQIYYSRYITADTYYGRYITADILRHIYILCHHRTNMRSLQAPTPNHLPISLLLFDCLSILIAECALSACVCATYGCVCLCICRYVHTFKHGLRASSLFAGGRNKVIIYCFGAVCCVTQQTCLL